MIEQLVDLTNEMELCYNESSLFKKFTFEVLGESDRS